MCNWKGGLHFDKRRIIMYAYLQLIFHAKNNEHLESGLVSAITYHKKNQFTYNNKVRPLDRETNDAWLAICLVELFGSLKITLEWQLKTRARFPCSQWFQSNIVLQGECQCHSWKVRSQAGRWVLGSYQTRFMGGPHIGPNQLVFLDVVVLRRSARLQGLELDIKHSTVFEISSSAHWCQANFLEVHLGLMWSKIRWVDPMTFQRKKNHFRP